MSRYTRHILMGDPQFFSIKGGANPHTRTRWGWRKEVHRELAIKQWRRFKETLIEHGVMVHVIPPDPICPGLVYPANAGFLFQVEDMKSWQEKTFYLSNLIATRRKETPVYRQFLENLNLNVKNLISERAFEGEADFFPAGDLYLFTYGVVRKQRFVPQLGFPPWKRVYGFRSDERVFEALKAIMPPKSAILPLKLNLESHYHGDTVLCSFGPERQYILAWRDGLSKDSQICLEQRLEVIWMEKDDAKLYAANSFQIKDGNVCTLFMPSEISSNLERQITDRGVKVVRVEVGEFLAKGGGSVKCMIGDLGPDVPFDPNVVPEKTAANPVEPDFRNTPDKIDV